MRQKILQTFIIWIVLVLLYTILQSTHTDNLENFFQRLLYLVIVTIIPWTTAIVFWLFLSEQLINKFKLGGLKKYIIYLALNLVLSLLIFLIINGEISQSEFKRLWELVSDEYFKDLGSVFISIIPTVVKFVIDNLSVNNN